MLQEKEKKIVPMSKISLVTHRLMGNKIIFILIGQWVTRSWTFTTRIYLCIGWYYLIPATTSPLLKRISLWQFITLNIVLFPHSLINSIATHCTNPSAKQIQALPHSTASALRSVSVTRCQRPNVMSCMVE